MNILVDNEEITFIKNNRQIGFVNELAKRLEVKPQALSRYFKIRGNGRYSLPESHIKEARKLLKEQTGLVYQKTK